MKRGYDELEGLGEEAKSADQQDDMSTEVKLAMLASLSAVEDPEVLLEALLAASGNVEAASAALGAAPNSGAGSAQAKKSAKVQGYQSSLTAFTGSKTATPNSPKKVTRKGKTLHLYSPEDIAAHTPCSLVHNFLDPEVADDLLREMLQESPTYYRDKFNMFDKVVESPHTFAFYVDELEQIRKQQTDYVYNGSNVSDVRKTLPQMRKVAAIVQRTVNEEIQKRIRTNYPEGKKLRFQSPDAWQPNTSFVNCYDGGKESVGWHSDQLTYVGPRPVIGSISLGVAREFRVRRVTPRNKSIDATDEAAKKANEDRADTDGQISIHLPHNSLLVMHAEMQEEWKHSIAPAQSIDPHPIAQNKRINITYRYYRPAHAPQYTPKCRCGVQTVLRCVQKQEETRGRYMWMCHVGYVPGKKGCPFFEWAKFNDDGDPVWWPQRAAAEEAVSAVDHKKPP